MKTEELLKVYKAGVDFDDFIILKICEDQSDYLFPNLDYISLRLKGWINVENRLTKQGEEILAKCQQDSKTSKKTDVGMNSLFIACQDELLKLTGKKQKTSKIENKSYSFLPNFIDFQDKISKTVKKYKLDDNTKLKSVLLQYINKCHEANNWFPILEYYISKDNKSKLATDYFNFEEKEVKKGTTFEI